MTVRRIIAFIILVPVAIVLIAFIVANRAPVRLALDPFTPDESVFTFTAPFSVWLFVFLAIGMVTGSMTTWFSQHKYRKAARERQAELDACRMELRRQRNELHIS